MANEVIVSGDIHHIYDKNDTIKIKLMKMSKSMQWELTYEGEDVDAVIVKLKEADEKLRAIYEEGGQTE